MIAIAPPHEKILPNYTSWLESHGFDYYVLGPGEIMKPGTKILMLCGGPDIGTKPDRDHYETQLFIDALKDNVAVVGICRGMQLVNVLLGGTLIDDIVSESVKHTANKLVIANTDGFSLASSFHKVVGHTTGEFIVNSRHHQAIEKVASCLHAIAYSEDGIIEAAQGDKIFLVQWHPEREEVRGWPCEELVSFWIKLKLTDFNVYKNKISNGTK
jgi:gamma-glutamyl-gamma-aminobutyrate hydrolase PuuD